MSSSILHPPSSMLPPLHRLSPAQRRVLALIGAGRMTKEIAAEMHLSEKGVEYHRGVIYRTLGIQSVGEAVRVALTAEQPPPP